MLTIYNINIYLLIDIYRSRDKDLLIIILSPALFWVFLLGSVCAYDDGYPNRPLFPEHFPLLRQSPENIALRSRFLGRGAMIRVSSHTGFFEALSATCEYSDNSESSDGAY